MDIDLKLLGPYANKFQTALKASSEKTPVHRPSQPRGENRRANFGALHKKQNIRFLQDECAKRKTRQQELEESRKGRRSQLLMQARKPNMRDLTSDKSTIIHEVSGEAEDNSSMDCEFEMLTDYSKSENVAVKDGINKNAAARLGQTKPNATGIVNSAGNNTRNANNNGQVLKPQQITIKESRREQLLKWKKEKEAADHITKKNQRQPFKTGVAVVAGMNKTPKIVNTTNANSKSVSSILSGSSNFLPSKPTGGFTFNKQVTESRQNAATSKTNNGSYVDGRRVTRAMSKGQAVTNITSGNLNNGHATTNMKPTIQQMKTLNLTEKTSTAFKNVGSGSGVIPKTQNAKAQAKSNSSANIQKPAIQSTANSKSKNSGNAGSSRKQPVPQQSNIVDASNSSGKIVKTPSSNNIEVNSTTNDVSIASCDNGIVHNPHMINKPEETQKKKLKPKAIDATYIEYNAKFSNACLKLKSYKSEWTTTLDQNKQLPEEIQGDIQSALGKIKLLLDSKLPQFGQLMFSYLCQEADPLQIGNQILACDLEGWWDVACIQLDAVDAVFENLLKLKDNDWRKVQERGKTSTKIKVDDQSGNINQSQARSKPVKVQASGGLKAFLANKRKMLSSQEDNGTDTQGEQVIEVVKVKEGNKSPEVDKTFEGGFFTINSPVVACETPERPRRERSISSHNRTPIALSSVPSSLRTPTRRLNSSETSMNRMSLCILGVRKSMGPINRMGVVPISADAASEAEHL